MTDEFQFKLRKISDAWNYFILEYKLLQVRLKLNEEVNTNYFGDILGYFGDVTDIIFPENLKKLTHTDKFSFTISFLQAIYVQQDFVEEMLRIFKTGFNKGDLKKDTLYSLTREIRNEIIGHPIRKAHGKLLSSTLFSYQSRHDEIEYLRYHLDNGYKFEAMRFKIKDMQDRHIGFLNKYFQIILDSLYEKLAEYLQDLKALIVQLDNQNFETVLKLTKIHYESIFNYDFIYDSKSLKDIYLRRNEHKRYQNLIDRFYCDLKKSLLEKVEFANTIFMQYVPVLDTYLKDSEIAVQIMTKKYDIEDSVDWRAPTYNYELGKLATKRDNFNFDFFAGILRRKCEGNNLVQTELDHMARNLDNDIEYYTALRLIIDEINNY